MYHTDPHAAWSVEWERLRSQCDQLIRRHQCPLRLHDAAADFRNRIAETPASTVDGLLIQNRLQTFLVNGTHRDIDKALAKSMRLGIERLAGAS